MNYILSSKKQEKKIRGMDFLDPTLEFENGEIRLSR